MRPGLLKTYLELPDLRPLSHNAIVPGIRGWDRKALYHGHCDADLTERGVAQTSALRQQAMAMVEEHGTTF